MEVTACAVKQAVYTYTKRQMCGEQNWCDAQHTVIAQNLSTFKMLMCTVAFACMYDCGHWWQHKKHEPHVHVCVCLSVELYPYWEPVATKLCISPYTKNIFADRYIICSRIAKQDKNLYHDYCGMF